MGLESIYEQNMWCLSFWALLGLFNMISSSIHFLANDIISLWWKKTLKAWMNILSNSLPLYLFIYLFIYFCDTGAWTQGPSPWATPPAQFFVIGFFWDRVSWTIYPGWLWTVILLISASWVARITGVSHWCLAFLFTS
jgi:hypothetical protein